MTQYRVVVCGPRSTGKTTLRIRALWPHVAARDVWRVSVETGPAAHVSILRGVDVAVDECQQPQEYRGISALVYVVDATQPFQPSLLDECCRHLRTEAPDAKLIVAFAHADAAVSTGGARLRELDAAARRVALPTLAHIMATSPWDESVLRPWYVAFAHVLALARPDVKTAVADVLERVAGHLKASGVRMQGAEAVLFDQATAVPLVHVLRGRTHGAFDSAGSAQGPPQAAHRAEQLAMILRRLAAGTRAALAKGSGRLDYAMPSGVVLSASDRTTLVVSHIDALTSSILVAVTSREPALPTVISSAVSVSLAETHW